MSATGLHELVERLEATACQQGAVTEHLLDVLDAEVVRVEGRDAVVDRLTAELSTATGEVERLRALLAVTQSSLEAASSGRRVTACDEIERLQLERDALQDAAREYLDGRTRMTLDALDAARTRLAALAGRAP